jgi:hypothetical protein
MTMTTARWFLRREENKNAMGKGVNAGAQPSAPAAVHARPTCLSASIGGPGNTGNGTLPT